jgi:tetratricopeptide (TPR) repeat protein
MNRRRLTVPLAYSAFVLMVAASSQAEPTATQKATAETLFQRGVELADSGRLAEACSQFDASLQIDPALGTLFRLADCYDRIGRTASAWALFSEARARAKAAEQAPRERIAAERVQNLEARLSKLSLSVGANVDVPGLELRMNDVVVPRASWGLELPVDPGPQRLRLSAPGRRTWVGTVTVEKGPSSRHFSLSELAPAAVETPARSALPPPPPPSPRQAADAETHPAWLGYTVAGVGLASAGVAAVMAYRAYDLNQQSLDECSRANANACTRQGDAWRDEARSAGVASTAFAIAGGALFAGGVALVLLRPSSKEEPSVALATQATAGGALAGVVGAF